MNCDLIFLSDLRLNNRDSVKDLEAIFKATSIVTNIILYTTPQGIDEELVS